MVFDFLVFRELLETLYFISGTPPYVPELDGPTDVSNFDIDDLMEAKSQVSGKMGLHVCLSCLYVTSLIKMGELLEEIGISISFHSP